MDVPSQIGIRHLASMGEFERCTELQERIWGDGFREAVPPSLMMVSQKVGGISAGAFRGDELVGFVYGVTGWLNGAPIHWSHMLGVAPEARDRGLGRRLKEFQRQTLLRGGVTRMRWTFDPLVARNAHLNLNRLGAVVIDYVPDLYGINETSVMDGIIGTDRFIVEWDLRASPPNAPIDVVLVTANRIPRGPDDAVTDDLWPDQEPVYVEVPDDIQDLKHARPDEARWWRRMTRAIFLKAREREYAIRRLVQDASGVRYYELERVSADA